jgi:hypothetical protein
VSYVTYNKKQKAGLEKTPVQQKVQVA